MATNSFSQPLAPVIPPSIPSLQLALNHSFFSTAMSFEKVLYSLFEQMENNDDLSLSDRALLEENRKSIACLLVSARSLFQADAKHDYLNKEYYKNEYSQAFKTLKDQIGLESLKTLMACLIKSAANSSYAFFAILYYANTYCDQAYEHLRMYQRAEEIGHYSAYLYEDEAGVYHDTLSLKDPVTEVAVHYHRVPIRIADQTINYKLIGEVLIPQDQNEDTLYVAWAGTHSKETTLADLERSAGEETYRAHEDQVLQQIISAINNYHYDYQKPLRLVFTGHSLGGAYSQLSFHTLQRALILKMAQNPICSFKDEAQKDELTFIEKMVPYSPNVKLIENIPASQNLVPSMIKEMRLDVWNSIGVLAPVAQSSNKLCRWLVDSGISQVANYGVVHGDLLQTAGQGMILSDIPDNGAVLSLLKITSRLALGATTKSTSVIGSIVAGKMVGHMIFPGFGGLVGALVAGGASLGTMIYHSMQSHKQLHFNNEPEPESYKLYFSKHPQDVDYIVQELKAKSVVVEGVTAMLSAFNLSNQSRDLELDFRNMIIRGNLEGISKALVKIATFYTGTFYAYTSVKDNDGNTPLHLLALNGNVELWQVIANFTYSNYQTIHIIDFNITNSDGLLPIEVAARAGHIALVEAMGQRYLADKKNFNETKLNALIEQAKEKSDPKVKKLK